MLETMYPAAVNSRQTELATDIDDTQTSFTVLDGSVLPPAPNQLTLGTDESAETIKYTGKTGNEITGVTRAFEGAAKSWAAGTKLARYFTAYDHNTFKANIEDLNQRLENIPAPQDASLTDKGIVQLSNKTDGDAENVAATEKAINDARVAAISAAAKAADIKYISKNRPSNKVPNSTGEFGKFGWTDGPYGSDVWVLQGLDDRISSFRLDSSGTSGDAYMDSVSMTMQTGRTFTISVDFENLQGVANQLYVQVRNASTIVATVSNDAVVSRHRKSFTFTVPSGFSNPFVRVGLVKGAPSKARYVSKITLAEGADADIWNQDANDAVLFQSVSDGKTAIAAAITGKNVPASGSDTFPQLATKIGQISTGPKYATGTATSTAVSFAGTRPGGAGVGSYALEIVGLPFKPNRIIIREVTTTPTLTPTVYTDIVKNNDSMKYATLSYSDNNSINMIKVTESTSDSFYVGETGFRLPVINQSRAYVWEAFRV